MRYRDKYILSFCIYNSIHYSSSVKHASCDYIKLQVDVKLLSLGLSTGCYKKRPLQFIDIISTTHSNLCLKNFLTNHLLMKNFSNVGLLTFTCRVVITPFNIFIGILVDLSMSLQSLSSDRLKSHALAILLSIGQLLKKNCKQKGFK